MKMPLNEYAQIIKECKKFALKEIQINALTADLEKDSRWVESVWGKSWELDLPALIVPEESGGVGASNLLAAFILDALAYECAGVASVFAHHYAGCLPLILSGSEAQKSNYFKMLGEKSDQGSTTLSVIFPGTHSDAQINLKEKNGQLVLSGSSGPVTNVDFAKYFCVFTVDKASTNAVSCVIVDKDAAGIEFSEPYDFMGLKVNPFRRVYFNEVVIPPETIIGPQSDAAKLLQSSRDAYNGFIAAMSVGVARRCYDKAFEYAKGRYQHGQNIIYHSEMQRMLGAMQTKIHCGAASYFQVFNDEARRLPSGNQITGRSAKIFCSDSAVEIAIDAIQVHGGVGYMHEFGVEKLMRDVKVLNVMDGTTPALNVLNTSEKLIIRGR